jgi:hypothetical protein
VVPAPDLLDQAGFVISCRCQNVYLPSLRAQIASVHQFAKNALGNSLSSVQESLIADIEKAPQIVNGQQECMRIATLCTME